MLIKSIYYKYLSRSRVKWEHSALLTFTYTLSCAEQQKLMFTDPEPIGDFALEDLTCRHLVCVVGLMGPCVYSGMSLPQKTVIFRGAGKIKLVAEVAVLHPSLVGIQRSGLTEPFNEHRKLLLHRNHRGHHLLPPGSAGCWPVMDFRCGEKPSEASRSLSVFPCFTTLQQLSVQGSTQHCALTTAAQGESWSCCSWHSQHNASKCFTYSNDQSPHEWAVLQSSKTDCRTSSQFGLKWICQIGMSDVKWKWIPQISIYFIGKHYRFFYRLTLVFVFFFFFPSSPLPTPTFSRIECCDLREAV